MNDERPESTTSSLVFRPFATNLAVIFCSESNGDGICWFDAVRLAVVPSLLPKGTAQYGPPTCNQKQNLVNWKQSECRWDVIQYNSCENLITKQTASIATIVRISAHETTDGHELSTTDFMLSITSNPLTELQLGRAFYSLVMLAESSALQESYISLVLMFTFTKQSGKCMRRGEAAILVPLRIACNTPFLTIRVRFRQEGS